MVDIYHSNFRYEFYGPGLITNLMFLCIPLQELSSKLLSYHDLNVISVDWGGGSASMYSTSAANTRVVGLEVAHLINFLKVN